MPGEQFNSSEEWDLKTLIGNYNKGLKGSYYDPVHYNKFMASLPMPYFSEAAPHLKGSGKGKVSTPFRSVLHFDPNAYEEKQVTGDCTVAGSKVTMADGTLKNIEDVKIGDEVISHTNKKRKVIDLIKKPYSGKIVKFWTDGNTDPLEFTPDHLFIVVDNKNKMSWRKIDDIWPGEHVLMPFGVDENECKDHIIDLADILPEGYTISEEDPTKIKAWHAKDYCNRYINIDEDMGWLIGIYLAEGGLGEGRSVCFSLNLNEIDFSNKISRIIENKFGITCVDIPKEEDTSRRVYCFNKTVGEFFNWMCPGNVYTKEINPLIFKCKKEVRFKCLRGWVDGDGNFTLRQRKDPRYWELRARSQSVSKKLRDAMWRIAVSIGLKSKKTTTPKAEHQTEDAQLCHFYGRRAIELFPEHEANAASKVKLRNDNDICQYGIKVKIKAKQSYEVSNIFVYCIGVEEEHSFICGSISCHNCVSHATRNAVDVTRCVQAHLGIRPEGWVARGATEAIYGSRGHNGQGMSCSGAADFVHKRGGIILRQKFASADLTRYTGMTGAGWGGRGVPNDIVEIGKQHQIQTVSQIRSLEEARDAIANGYGVAVCSNQGFSSVRDSKGFARAQGSWSHGMAWTGVDDSGSEPAFLDQNSWGAWNSGGQPDWGPIPPGSFLIHADIAHRMISAGGAFAFSHAIGYPAQKLPDYGTSSFL